MADKDNPGKKEAYKVELDTSAMHEYLEKTLKSVGLCIIDGKIGSIIGGSFVGKQPNSSKAGLEDFDSSVPAETRIKGLLDDIELSPDNVAEVVDKLKEILVRYEANERNRIIARHIDAKYPGKRLSHPKLGKLLEDEGDSPGKDARKSRAQRARGKK